MLFDMRKKPSKRRRNPCSSRKNPGRSRSFPGPNQRVSIYEKAQKALAAKGIESGRIQYLGKWRFVRFNHTAVFPVQLKNGIGLADLLVAHFPNDKDINVSLWEFNHGGQGEGWRLAPESIGLYGNYSDDSAGLREMAEDVKQALVDYDELLERNMPEEYE